MRANEARGFVRSELWRSNRKWSIAIAHIGVYLFGAGGCNRDISFDFDRYGLDYIEQRCKGRWGTGHRPVIR
jgi:hypothetical protein